MTSTMCSVCYSLSYPIAVGDEVRSDVVSCIKIFPNGRQVKSTVEVSSDILLIHFVCYYSEGVKLMYNVSIEKGASPGRQIFLAEGYHCAPRRVREERPLHCLLVLSINRHIFTRERHQPSSDTSW